MKALLLIGAIHLAALASIADEVYKVDGKEVSKGEAIMQLAKNPQTKVQRITDMKLNSDKGTLVKK